MGAKPASLPEKCNLRAEDAAQGQCLLCASRISLPALRNVFGNPAQTQHRLKGCLLGSWQMLQETLVGGIQISNPTCFFGLGAEQDCLLCEGWDGVLLQDWGSDVAE